MTRIATHPASRSHTLTNALINPTSLFSVVIRMSRVRLTMMVVVAAWFGYAMAAGGADVVGHPYILWFLLAGVGLASMGSSVLNQVIERDADALMERTEVRPIPAGEISITTAMIAGVALSITGILTVWIATNGIAALLTAWTVVSYVLIYTPLKTRTTLSTVVGAIPGAMPPVIGVAAVTGALDATGWVMFAILFLWQIPHFLAIAWKYRTQYERAGMIVLPVADPSGGSTFRQILLSTMALIAVGLLPTMLMISGTMYFFGSLAAGIVLLCFGIRLAIGHKESHARAVFFATLVYLPVVYGLMLFDRV